MTRSEDTHENGCRRSVGEAWEGPLTFQNEIRVGYLILKMWTNHGPTCPQRGSRAIYIGGFPIKIKCEIKYFMILSLCPGMRLVPDIYTRNQKSNHTTSYFDSSSVIRHFIKNVTVMTPLTTPNYGGS